ncbi:MAG: lytic transglycosylase domain-containing protein [Magnetococcales bacterium]|nr:lytic transglycosylase domain-containing protein [Magnetococcales bacterium]
MLRNTCWLLSAFGIWLLAQPAMADIFTFTDANGVIHLTDRPLGPEYRLLISSASKDVKKWRSFPTDASKKRPLTATSSKVIHYDGRNKTLPKVVSYGQNTYPTYLTDGKKGFSETIQDASMRYRIHTALIKAVIKTESDFNPLAVSPKGAVGLMQLMPGTAKDLGVMDRMDPVDNIHGGVRYLRDLLGQFDNNLVLSLAAYNAGPGAVKKYGNTVPPYVETQQYVSRVLHFYRAYLGAM